MYTGPQDTRVLTGVMDQDSAAWAVKPENYRYALNLINIYNQQKGSHTNIAGTVEVINSNLVNATNKCLGYFEDVRGSSVIFFVYNSLGHHGIFRWYQNRPGYPNGVIETIYQVQTPSAYTEYDPNPLSFDPDHLITGVNLVDDLLFWTDYHTGPKMTNIARANETGKKRQFNLYFNDNTFGRFTNGLTHTLNLYAPGIAAPVSTLTWVMPITVSTYYEAVQNLLSFFNGSPFAQFVSLIDKNNYCIAEILLPGKYMLEWTNNAFAPYYSGMIVPENFYPDTTPTTVSYAPMKDDLIERIKYPPRCSPEAEFEVIGAGNFNFEISSMFLQNSAIPPAIVPQDFYTYYYYSGISNVFSDTLNLVTTGSNVVIGPSTPTPYGDFNAYIENTTSGPLLLNIRTDLVINMMGWFGLQYYNPPGGGLNQNPGNQAFRIYLGIATNNTTPPTPLYSLFQWDASKYVGAGEFDPTTTYNIPSNNQIILQPGQRLGVYSTSSAMMATWSGTISGEALDPALNFFQSNIFPSFRAKYVYDDYQSSVYGAISPTVVSPSSKYKQVLLDFTDPRLESEELSSDVRNVVLSVSLDSGTTWNDFATLDPYEFVGPGRQKYIYKGTEVLLTVPEAVAILPYHNVPRLSKGQEFVDDRIWDSDLLTGYNKEQIKIEIEVDYESLNTGEFYSVSLANPPQSVSRFRRGWRGFIGVVYYDDADRRSPVCIDPVNSFVEIPSYCEEITILSTPQKGLNPAFLRASILTSPPSWAKKYQFVRSLDLSQQTYLVWCSDEVDLVDDDGNIVAPSLAKYIRVKVDNIAYYDDNANKGAKISFTFVDGDRLRFIQNVSGVFYPANDYVISSVTGTEIFIVYDGSISPADGDLIELYSTRDEAEKLLYYEFGECYPIESNVQNGILVKYHTGNVQDQIFSPVPLNVFTPAISELKVGDVWYRTRKMYYHTTGTPAFNTVFISSSTPSDFTDINHDNNGRVNATDLQDEIYQPTGIVFSDQYISGTKINGLSAVQPANYKQFSTVYGPANKLLVVNNDILKIFFGNGYQLSIYVNQGVIRQAQGGGNILSVIDEVAANSHIIQRSLGTVNAESVVLNDEGDVFGYDGLEGVCWLGAGNGLVDISDTGMSITWRNYGLERLALDQSKSQTPAVFDLSNDQYIITLNALGPNPEVLPVAHVKLPDITTDFLSQGGAQVDIVVQPNNMPVYSQFTTETSWINILSTAFPPGWSVVVNSDGSLDITAPNVAGYSNSSLIISVTYNGSFTIPPTASTGTYTFPFTGGQQASYNSPFPAVTLAYNKSRRGWINYYSFTPEMYGRLRNQVVSFVDGRLYLHGKGATYNNFYGTQYGSILRYLLNNDYPKVKVPLSIWYRGTGQWGAILRNPATGSYPWGQETEMTPAHFILEEDGYYAAVMKNRLDPRYPTTDQAWVNGEDIRGDATEIELYNNQLVNVRLDMCKTLYLYSENS